MPWILKMEYETGQGSQESFTMMMMMMTTRMVMAMAMTMTGNGSKLMAHVTRLYQYFDILHWELAARMLLLFDT